MSDKNLNPCNEPGGIPNLDIDPPPPYCRDGETIKTSGTIDKQPFLDSQKDVSQDLSWLDDATKDIKKLGNHAMCDPQITGHIINDQGSEPPNRGVVYRHSKSLDGTDLAVTSLFKDIVVIDEDGKSHQIPIIWGSQEKAVAYIVQENTRKDESLVIDRIRLPIMAIYRSSTEFNQKRYAYHKAINYLRQPINDWKPGFTTKEKYERDTIFGVSRGIPIDFGYDLYAWTMYEQDMNQIFTQIVTKCCPMGYIRVRDIPWEIGVKLNSVTSNVNLEPGDKQLRIIKYQFNFLVEGYISQPIVRKKAVLKTKIEIADSTEEEDITTILARLESAVKELSND